MLITASRTALERTHVGNATTVITREEIERRQARYVTDLLRSVPGFSVSQLGTRGAQTQVRVRGAEADHVLVLIDGVPANDPATSDQFRWELLSAYNIEQIEIVRGPQSALWGSEALAAVVQIVTRTDNRAARMDGFAETGSDDTLNAGLSGGTGGDNWSIDYGLSRLDTDGTNISRSGDEDDGSDLTTASLGARLEARDDLTLDLAGRYVDSTSQFDPVDFFVTGLPTDGDRSTNNKQLYLQTGATLAQPNRGVTHGFKARFFETRNTNLADGSLDASTKSDRTTLAWQTDLQLERNTLSFAAEHERTTFDQRGEATEFGDPNQSQAITTNSAMIDVQVRQADSVTLLASARYDDNSDFDDALTGRVSLAWEADATTKFRASLGTGQKTPTFTERFGFFPGQFVGNPNLKPEESTAFDAGVEKRFLDQALELQLTYFKQDLENEINGFVFDPVTFQITAENTAGDSTRKGIELESRYLLMQDLELTATYTYTDSTSEDEQGIDSREIRRPRHAGSLQANYRFLQDRGNLNLVADYGGSQTDTFFPPLEAPETVKLGGYWLLDIAAGFDLTPGVNLFVRASNLLDEDYEQVFGYATPGRSVYAGVRVAFEP